MPRANRYIVPGHTYHVTHRCHDRTFLFRFAVDRNAYRRMLRERLQAHPVALLGYCLTSNHVHLLTRIREGGTESLARFMQSLQGDFAQHYNRRKRRNGAFWSDRYHAVMIDGERHLWRCLRYIDLNMVRAGVVEHPTTWDWCGYNELLGVKKRNRLIDQAELLRAVGDGGITIEGLRQIHEEGVAEAIKKQALAREAYWTESLIVGSQAFVERVGRQIRNRASVDVSALVNDTETWIVREQRQSYGAQNDPKNCPIHPEIGIYPFVSA